MLRRGGRTVDIALDEVGEDIAGQHGEHTDRQEVLQFFAGRVSHDVHDRLCIQVDRRALRTPAEWIGQPLWCRHVQPVRRDELVLLRAIQLQPARGAVVADEEVHPRGDAAELVVFGWVGSRTGEIPVTIARRVYYGLRALEGD